MRLNSFEMQEMREIGRKETNELRGFYYLVVRKDTGRLPGGRKGIQ